MRGRRLDLTSVLFRLLLAVGCVLPFSDPSVLASVSTPTPADVIGQEEDEREKEKETDTEKEKEEADPKNRTPDRRPGVAPLTARHAVRYHLRRSTATTRHSALRPTSADPFRNGLGSPYRC